MKLLKGAVAAVLVLGPSLAFAATPGYLDGYYIANSTLHESGHGGAGADDGDGYGVRAAAPIGDLFFVSAEYQTANLDVTDLDVDQIRAGLGVMTGDALRFGGLVEYIHLKLDAGGGYDSKPDGYGLHGRMEYSPVSAATLYGQLGYVRLSEDGDSADGLEWQVGAAYNFLPMFGAFVDYRETDLKDDGIKEKFKDVRLGLRWNFGAM